MKQKMRTIFSPILKQFESGETEYVYRESHRVILKIIGVLFLIIACGSLYASVKASQPGGALPVIVFFLLGLVCEIVAFFGTDRGVANIWKSR